jgi:hypothetical protein
MTTDIRSRLIARMNAALTEKTRNVPDSIPISLPLGPLADAVIDEMSGGRGVPLIPDYDHEVWSIRRWTQPFTQAEMLDGGVSDVGVRLDPENAARVLFTTQCSGTRPEWQSEANMKITVSLPAADAEQFLIAGLAAVKAARDATN